MDEKLSAMLLFCVFYMLINLSVDHEEAMITPNCTHNVKGIIRLELCGLCIVTVTRVWNFDVMLLA